LTVLSAGADPLSDAAKKELAALDGDWLVMRTEQKGQKREPGERVVLTIRGTKWSLPATEEDLEVTALDPAASPKTIDFKITSRKTVTNERVGIFKRDGDTFTLVMYQRAGKKRPKGFDTPTEAGVVLYVFKREKK
jgi:uncharacterized protein (TIGR03067 family)